MLPNYKKIEKSLINQGFFNVSLDQENKNNNKQQSSVAVKDKQQIKHNIKADLSGITKLNELKKELSIQKDKYWHVTVNSKGNIQKFLTKNDELNNKLLSKHQDMELYSELLREAGLYQASFNVLSCGARVIYGKKGNKIVPVDIQRCHDKYCKNCALIYYQRKAKIAEKVVSKALKDNPNCNFLEVTVCPKNVRDWLNLNYTLKKLNSSVSKVAGYAGIKEFCYGYIRSLEAPLSTRGKIYSYNNHLNIMFFMNKSFFSGKNMLTKKRWKQRFKQAMKLDYLPDMYFKRIKETKDTKGNVTSMISNAKKRVTYDMKPNTLVKSIYNNQQLFENDSQKKIIRDYYYGTKNVNKVGFCGLMQGIKKEIESFDNVKNNQSVDKTPISMYYDYKIVTVDPETLEKKFRLVGVSNFNPLHPTKKVKNEIKNQTLKKELKIKREKYKHGFGVPTLINGSRV